MSAQHTPGPWSYSTCPNDFAFEHIQSQGGTIIAKPMRMGSEGGMEANARLIADAPELLHELDVREGDLFMLRNAIEAGDPKAELLVRVEDMLRETRAALAKVRGAA
jgi:hypothetical protein